MRRMLCKSLALAIAACASLAHASTLFVTEDLFGEVVGGPALGEIASGSFTYDLSFATGTGEEIIGPPGLTVSLDFLGQLFDEEDDIDFADFPQLTLIDGVPVSLDFVVVNGDGVGDEILDPRVTEFNIFDLFPEPGGGFFAPIFTIPEPTSGAILAGGLALVAQRRRRRA